MKNPRVQLIRWILLMVLLNLGGVAVALGQASAGIPTDFPKDIPVYQNAKPTKFQPAPKGMPPAAALNVLFLETPDSKGSVLEFYRRELTANGWKLEKPFSGSPDAIPAMKGSRMLSMGALAHSGTKSYTTIQLGYIAGQ
jgi:hypothetical protein